MDAHAALHTQHVSIHPSGEQCEAVGPTWWLMCSDAMGSAAAPEVAGALSRSALLMLCARATGSSTSAADDVGGTDAGLCAAGAV